MVGEIEGLIDLCRPLQRILNNSHLMKDGARYYRRWPRPVYPCPMELKQIRYFIALFEEGTVTRAARQLNIAQPALSMQIAKLETEIRQKLFERGPHGMPPTEAARLMYRLY